MRLRWPCPVSRVAVPVAMLSALAALAWGLAGCGDVAIKGASDTSGSPLTIYSSLPLQGPSGAISAQIVNGEKLALANAGGRAGRFKVGYVSLDDSNPTSGGWDPGVTATDAKTAAQNTSTIAYLGELDSAATAISLPLTNGAGILQVSPASPYVGLTSSLDAGQDEPGRFYPTGTRTFGRLQPGDPIEAAAQARLIGGLGAHKVYVLDDQDPFAVPLAQLVAGDAERAGIAVAGHDSIATPASAVFTGEVERIVKSGAEAVFFAGGPGRGPQALWQQLHRAAPSLWLLGSSALAEDSFIAGLGPAGARTMVTTPLLAAGLYPRSAARVLSEYRRRFDAEAGPEALYGYEAMSVVLDAIRSAGPRGGNRQAVIERFLSVRGRDSVLGRYSVQANGETTLSRYGVERIVNGRAVFYRAIDAG